MVLLTLSLPYIYVVLSAERYGRHTLSCNNAGGAVRERPRVTYVYADVDARPGVKCKVQRLRVTSGNGVVVCDR